MKKLNDLKSLSPDLYLRYLYGFEIIKNFQKNNPCTILDVGGRAGILGDFIKLSKLPYKLTVIDDLPDPDSNKTTCDQYINKNFLTFNTKKRFDFLTTFDVLEHVNKKKNFITKCLSLSNNIVLTAPFKSEIINQAEKRADQYFLKYKGIHYPWLKEHFESGLPEINWLTKYLNLNKVKYNILESNNIENWINFILPNFLPSFQTIDIKKLYIINRYYNENYRELGDNISPSYRKIFIISMENKKSFTTSFQPQPLPIDHNKKIIFFRMVNDFFIDIIRSEELRNSIIQQNYIDENKILKENNLELKKRYEKITKMLDKNNVPTKQISEINIVVSNYQSENQNLRKNIEEVNYNISNLETTLNTLVSSKYYKIWRLYCTFKDTIKI